MSSNALSAKSLPLETESIWRHGFTDGLGAEASQTAAIVILAGMAFGGAAEAFFHFTGIKPTLVLNPVNIACTSASLAVLGETGLTAYRVYAPGVRRFRFSPTPYLKGRLAAMGVSAALAVTALGWQAYQVLPAVPHVAQTPARPHALPRHTRAAPTVKA